MNTNVKKQTALILLVFGMSMIVLGLTIGQLLEPLLYIFIPMGLFFIIVALIRMKAKKKKNNNENE